MLTILYLAIYAFIKHYYSNMHVKKFSWHKDIQDINSVTCATYIQVFIASCLTVTL